MCARADARCFKRGVQLIWESQCAEECAMPQYEYLCSSCSKKFSTILSLAEHDKNKIQCPKCGSTKVEQQWAAFFATTSKKS